MADSGAPWQPIRAFESSAEYRELLSFLTAEITKGIAESVPVERPYSGSTLMDEHWYRNVRTNELWRLVAPDPPFRGVFKRVE